MAIAAKSDNSTRTHRGSALLLSFSATLAGFCLVWWAVEQFDRIQVINGSEFVLPEIRLLFWTVTLVAAGFAFGLAVTNGAHLALTRRSVLLLAGLPAFVVIWFYLVWAIGWSPLQPSAALSSVLLSQQMVITSTVVLGVLLSALVGPKLATQNL